MAFDSRRKSIRLKLARGLFLGLFLTASIPQASAYEGMLPAGPESEYLSLSSDSVAGAKSPFEPTVDFCSEWNPEFAYRGHKCCGESISKNFLSKKRALRSAKARCAPERTKWGFCDEMTPDQQQYVDDVKTGRIPDVLKHLESIFDTRGKQSYCTSMNGFLVSGRPLLPTEENRIEIRNTARCTNYGTDRLIATMEWVGREVKKEFHESEYTKARIVVGDLSAPRGSCISGRAGKRAHKSHTTGVDIDVTFFNPQKNNGPEERFTRKFYAASNWWFLKKVFRNPYACVKVAFVDSSHIRMLKHYVSKVAAVRPSEAQEWKEISPFLKHIKGHKDHFHIRVGETKGAPGCLSEGPSDETDEEMSDAHVDEDTPETPAAEGTPAEDSAESDGEAGPSADAEGTQASAASAVDPAIPAKTGIVQKLKNVVMRTANAVIGPDEFTDAHKHEPEITQKLQAELKPKRRSRRGIASHKSKKRRRR